MNREERIKICRQCEHKTNDLKKGIVCSLSGDLPDFIEKCNDYKEIYKAPRIEEGESERNRIDFIFILYQ